MREFVLYARAGWGSAIVEAQLAYYGLPFRLADTGDLFDSEEAREKLKPLNPLTQVPVLVLPAGEVMTESAAMTLHGRPRRHRDDLVHGAIAKERAAFLRWLVFLVANVYPTFTYADDPKRFVKTEGAGDAFPRRGGCLREAVVGSIERSPDLAMSRMSALDISRRSGTGPGAKWFAENTPRVWAAAQKAASLKRLAGVMGRNFPKKA
ncbi:MAG: glutathione S-transferase [Rubrivivax sp.]